MSQLTGMEDRTTEPGKPCIMRSRAVRSPTLFHKGINLSITIPAEGQIPAEGHTQATCGLPHCPLDSFHTPPGVETLETFSFYVDGLGPGAYFLSCTDLLSCYSVGF